MLLPPCAVFSKWLPHLVVISSCFHPGILVEVVNDWPEWVVWSNALLMVAGSTPWVVSLFLPPPPHLYTFLSIQALSFQQHPSYNPPPISSSWFFWTLEMKNLLPPHFLPRHYSKVGNQHKKIPLPAPSLATYCKPLTEHWRSDLKLTPTITSLKKMAILYTGRALARSCSNVTEGWFYNSDIGV